MEPLLGFFGRYIDMILIRYIDIFTLLPEMDHQLLIHLHNLSSSLFWATFFLCNKEHPVCCGSLVFLISAYVWWTIPLPETLPSSVWNVLVWTEEDPWWSLFFSVGWILDGAWIGEIRLRFLPCLCSESLNCSALQRGIPCACPPCTCIWEAAPLIISSLWTSVVCETPSHITARFLGRFLALSRGVTIPMTVVTPHWIWHVSSNITLIVANTYLV